MESGSTSCLVDSLDLQASASWLSLSLTEELEELSLATYEQSLINIAPPAVALNLLGERLPRLPQKYQVHFKTNLSLRNLKRSVICAFN